ncbi:BLUF domain-containing protein [Psychrobacter sp. SZ93C1]|nr:BLUF domain-containing protein [Psychrobacter sp. SZ93C1]
MRHGEHVILRLTYISRYNNDNPTGEVTRILTQAQQNNERNGITGALVFNHNYFLQSIEGARPVINELLRKLVEDDRHYALQVIECREVEQRHWSKWSMKYLIPSDENKGLALKFSTGNQFNPYLMNTNQIMMLIDTLSELQEQEEIDASKKKKPWFSLS